MRNNEDQMKAVFDELMSGLDDVEAFLAGREEGF
jgi:hypothetical protein